MRIEVIKVKESFKPFWENGGKDFKAILMNNTIFLAVTMFIVIFALSKISLIGNYLSGASLFVVSTSIYVLICMWVLNIGMILARKHMRHDESTFMGNLTESILWIIVYLSCNKVRFLAGLGIVGGVFYSGLLEGLSKPWENYSLLGMLLVLILGLLGKNIGSLYMSEDGEVSKTVKGKLKVSGSLTMERVKQYNKLNSKRNGKAQLSVIFFFSATMFIMSYSELLLPFILLVGSICNYLLYGYSFEKLSMDIQQGSAILLVIDNDIDVEDTDEEDVAVESPNATSIDRLNGAGGLSKEKVLGEHWYLEDRPSVIPKDEEDDEDGNPKHE